MIILGTTAQTARKEHQCSLCLRVIQPGERYWRSRIIGDDPYVFKECAHCTALVARINEESHDWYDDDWGYDYDAVIDFDSADEATIRLIGLFRDRWALAGGSLAPLPGSDS